MPPNAGLPGEFALIARYFAPLSRGFSGACPDRPNCLTCVKAVDLRCDGMAPRQCER
jgi:hypothetical protein